MTSLWCRLVPYMVPKCRSVVRVRFEGREGRQRSEVNNIGVVRLSAWLETKCLIGLEKGKKDIFF